MSKNIIIEGIQGTGKSTLLHMLSSELKNFKVYREGDLSPVDLAWCSYMTEEDFDRILQRYSTVKEDIMAKTMVEDGYYITAYTQVLTEEPDFYKQMELHEIYNGRVDYETFRSIIKRRYEGFTSMDNIFECSLFQNAIESMLLFYEMSDDKIIEYYKEIYHILKEKNIGILYLDTNNIEENIMQIKKERTDTLGNELWFPLMMNFLKESPYGKQHNYEDISHMIEHFHRRRNLELRIIKEIFHDEAVIIPAKQYRFEDIYNMINR